MKLSKEPKNENQTKVGAINAYLPLPIAERLRVIAFKTRTPASAMIRAKVMKQVQQVRWKPSKAVYS